jgi:hypothetical protein
MGKPGSLLGSSDEAPFSPVRGPTAGFGAPRASDLRVAFSNV